MNNQQRKESKNLFHKYTNSWIQKDLDTFLSLLAGDVLVIECFGASYRGKKECKQWFSHWNANHENQVLSWETINHFHDALLEVSIIDWDFIYRYKGEENSFVGLTVLKVENGKITYIREYEAKKTTYRPFEQLE
ncbi:MAG: nuclear transport factor 2 family protein [Streptococcaceae bacterium]|jgi:hypothetical protein|nr:nuclear transport factor 2 family protein [Streptococcaceae bacterium]